MTADGRFRDRYPGPYRVVETDGGYAVRDPAGVLLAMVYTTHLPPEWTIGASVRLSRAEGRALATAIAALGGKGRKRKRPAGEGGPS